MSIVVVPEVATMPLVASWRPRRRQAGSPDSSDPGDQLVAQLYREHGGALVGYATRLTGDRHAAEDIVQEALVRAWRHRNDLSADRGSIRSWLFTVVRNITVDRARAQARRPVEAGADVLEVADRPASGAVEEAQHVVDQVVLRHALARLTPEHRQVLALVQLAGLSVAEAAEHLGVPPGTVKSRTYYALKALRLAYEEMGGTR
ncbi:MAG: sigma-70 family RNA polymerase sigma factor [Actinomycetales bacterium]